MKNWQELHVLAEKVITANRAAGRTIAVAESCTGGLLSAALTDIAGCSDVFMQGFVTYSNEAKQQSLGVSDDIISTFGAVSMAAAWAMAQGTLKASDADIAVSITGIAGPAGGTEKKPVGMVVFGRALKGQSSDDSFTQRVQFDSTDRAAIRHHATLFALDLLMPERDDLVGGDAYTLPAP